MNVKRRSYGRRNPGKRFARSLTVEEQEAMVATVEAEEESNVVVEPPKKEGTVPKSSNVIVPVDGEDDVPSLDKFMNLTHEENVTPEQAEEPVVEKPAAEQVLKTEKPEPVVEKKAEQVFEKKEVEAKAEETTATEGEKNVFVEEPKKPEVKVKTPKVKVKNQKVTEKEAFTDDPLATDAPVKKSKKKKKIVDPLAD